MSVSMRHAFVLAGLVLAPAPADPLHTTTIPPAHDARLLKLKEFFREREVPIQHLADDFILAADRNGIDWRLLPSIAIVESSGAKHYRNNNIFGWGNGDVRFRSIHSSIHEIAGNIGQMRCYRGKDLPAMLWTYNPIPGYRERILKAMSALDPDFRLTRLVMMPAGGQVLSAEPLRH